MNTMISTLTGLAERLSLHVRDPITALGMEVQNSVFSGENSSMDYPYVVCPNEKLHLATSPS